jgi:hypothetical protein
MVWIFEECRFDEKDRIQDIDLNEEDKIRDIGLVKKVEFEIFSKVYLFVNLWYSDWLGIFRALDRESLARFWLAGYLPCLGMVNPARFWLAEWVWVV